MRLSAMVLVGLVGLLHSYIAWFEIFAWESRGPKVFTTFDADLFPRTVQIAANQGIYNSFLAAGLFWSLVIREWRWQRNIAVCFLIFVLVAGLFGAATVSTRTFFVQSVPALLAMTLLYLSGRASQSSEG